MVVVVDLFDLNASWHCIRAICTSDRSDFVLSNFDELLCNVFANGTASLSRDLVSSYIMENGAEALGSLTYPNDCNSLHMVLKALRLLAGILLGHDGFNGGRRDS